jgi:hypothetical protein
VPDTEKIKHETNKIFLGFGASVIQRFYETWKIKPRFYFAGFLRFVCDMALTAYRYEIFRENQTGRKSAVFRPVCMARFRGQISRVFHRVFSPFRLRVFQNLLRDFLKFSIGFFRGFTPGFLLNFSCLSKSRRRLQTRCKFA